ncbi:MAG: hypothetical protein ACKVOM_09595 [Ferruginibacter sp.]
MKKLLTMLTLMLSIGFVASAQEVKTEVKKTSTAKQKVHNTFSKHKHYKGYKVIHKNGKHKSKKVVNTMTGETKSKKE